MLSLLFALLALQPSHALAHSDLTEDTIHAGTPVGAGGQAWKSTVKLTYSSNCTGVFIHHDVILTAAHCSIRNDEELVVSMYKENDPAQAVLLDLAVGDFRRVQHPAYRPIRGGMPGSNDLAIIILLKADKTIPDGFEPAQLQTSSDERASDPGRPAIVVGAGMINDREFSDSLRFVRGTVSHYMNDGVINVDFQRRQGVCGGDSGGPVFVLGRRGELLLTGITNSSAATLGRECGNPLHLSGINAKVWNWIQRERSKEQSR